MPKCFVCEKELLVCTTRGGQPISMHPVGCGVFTICFGYGSDFDQGGLAPYPDDDPNEKLLHSDEIRGYICDECVEKKISLLEGYKYNIKKSEERIV